MYIKSFKLYELSYGVSKYIIIENKPSGQVISRLLYAVSSTKYRACIHSHSINPSNIDLNPNSHTLFIFATFYSLYNIYCIYNSFSLPFIFSFRNVHNNHRYITFTHPPNNTCCCYARTCSVIKFGIQSTC